MKSLFAILFTLLVSTATLAQDVSPDALIRSVTDDVLTIVRKDKDIQTGNARKVNELIDAKVLPHFNFSRMTQLAMGQEWRKASPAQRKALADEFRILLVRTYSKALTEYRDQSVTFKPFVMKPADSDARVRTEIRSTGGGKPIGLDYFLEKKEGGWKVYDIEVGGISLVTNYRETFAAEIRAKGIDGLIASLQTKNKSADDKSAEAAPSRK